MLTVGDRVDRYLIERVLGQGGMGQVFVAHDAKLDRKVALKVLTFSGSLDDILSWSQRLLREARSAAAFNHPNVVAIYDVGEHEGQPFIAMELVIGETLRRHVGKASATEIPVRIGWLLDVARGLAAAHEQGIVHRDIKPDNVMLTKDGVIKIVDFGIARRKAKSTDPSSPTEVAETLTQAGALVGTVRYMPPEQMRGEAMDGRVDQFAWAVMAYELLSGEHPWTGGDFLALATEMLSKPPKSLRTLAAELPGPVVVAIERALSADPNERFATMTDLVEAMTKANKPEISEKRPRRLPALWVAAGIGALAAGAIGVSSVLLRSTVGSQPSASAASSQPEVALAGFRCSDAVVSGGDKTASDALARPIGYGACVRLAIETGLPWAHEKAVGTGVELSALGDAKVELTVGDPARVTLRLAELEATAEGKSPMLAMQRAVEALAPKIAPRALSPAERAAWGAANDESARRIERLWRKLVIADVSDTEGAIRDLIASDGDSPWPHAMKCLVTPTGSAQNREACAAVLERLDRVPATRAKALRALALFMTEDTNDEAPAAEVEARYRLAMMPYAEEVVGFEKVLARARLALILERQKKQDEAARIRADLAHMLAHADPKVRELVEKP